MGASIYKKIKQMAETQYGMQADYLRYTQDGLVICNGPERWIVDTCIKQNQTNKYKITLYHNNVIYNVNATIGRHPGYHKQWERIVTVNQLLGYIKRHYKKYYR